jgi:hypothetical protein
MELSLYYFLFPLYCFLFSTSFGICSRIFA